MLIPKHSALKIIGKVNRFGSCNPAFTIADNGFQKVGTNKFLVETVLKPATISSFNNITILPIKTACKYAGC